MQQNVFLIFDYCQFIFCFFFQGDFDVYEYVERFVSIVVGGGLKGGVEVFDFKILLDVFEKIIKELIVLDEKM